MRGRCRSGPGRIPRPPRRRGRSRTAPSPRRCARPRRAASRTGHGRRGARPLPADRCGSAGRRRPALRSRTAAGAPRGIAPRVPRGAASRPAPGSRSAPGSGSARGTCPRAPRRRERGPGSQPWAFSIRTAQNLNSGIFPNGSISSIVSRFAAASRKWNGMKQLPLASRCETFASSSMMPRRELTRARSPSSRPSSAASSGWMNTSALGAIASSA